MRFEVIPISIFVKAFDSDSISSKFLKNSIKTMGLNCGCPLGAHLPDLSIAACKESFGQIQKIFIQRIFSTGSTKNSIGSSSIGTKTAITALTTAADGTKLLVSPYIQNPTTEPGAARTFGGGNQTLGGIEIAIGREPTKFTGILYQESQETIALLKELACEEIGVFLIDENGNIGCIKETVTSSTTTTTNYLPIPVKSFFIGDKKFGGFEEPDSNSIEWSFLPNWSDKFAIVSSAGFDYNPLTDISNAASQNS